MTGAGTAAIGVGFHEYFQPVFVNAPKQKTEIYRLRYQVYCREFHFEREEDCPGGLERDAYDDHALHCLLKHVPTGRSAGCVRLIRHGRNGPDTPLPFEKFCGHSLNRNMVDPAKLPPHSYGEISRLAVAAEFRRRRGEDQQPYNGLTETFDFSGGERRHFPYISLGLYLSAAAIGLLTGLQGVFAMMEPRLARHLSHFGIRFIRAGEVIDYHGLRAPFYISREGLLGGLKPEVHRLLDVIKRDMEPAVRRAGLKLAR